MRYQEPEQLQSLLASVYGHPVKEDASLMAALQAGVFYRMTLGQTLDKGQMSEGDALALLQGRVRVLRHQGDNRPQTVLHLNAGDILDAVLWHDPHIQLMVSSAEVVWCPIPQSQVQASPVLRQYSESVYQQWQVSGPVQSLPSLSPVQAEPLSRGADDKPVSSSATAASILSLILAHFGQPLSTGKAGVPAIADQDDLIKVLQSNGFQCRAVHYTWSRLLNAPTPFIFVEDGPTFRWITGRQGNTLLSQSGNGTQRFIPSDIAPQRQFNAILIQPAPCTTSGAAPFTMGWYLRLAVQNWFLSTQMVLSSLIVQLFALGMPLFYMVIFDRVFGRQNLATLDIMTLGILILLIFDLLIKYLRAYVLSHQLEAIDRTSVGLFLERVFNLPLSRCTPQTLRAFSERFPELTKMNQAMASTLLVTSLDAAFSGILVVFLFLLHWQLAFISLASLIPIALITFWNTTLTKKRALQANKDQRQCQVKLTETLEQAETVQSLNVGQHLQNDIAKRIEQAMQTNFVSRFDRLNPAAGQGFIASLGTIVTLYFGAHEVLQGEISYGIYMAINMLSRQVIGSIQRLFGAITQFQEGLETMEQLRPLFQPEMQAQPARQGVCLTEVSGAIRLTDVCFRYQAESPLVLNHVNLEMEPGQKVILTGKSGSGKTTLIRLLQRLYEPQSGYITLDGFNLSDMDIGNLRSHIGVALQKPGILAGTLRENIALGNPAASMKEIVEAATLAHLDADILKLPQGLDAPVAPLGINLSGGQIARIALARLFLMKPSILILDEALAACDPMMTAALLTQIMERYRKSTCLFVTDYLPLHRQADLIVLLNDGQVVERGTYRELVQAKGYYAHLHQTQIAVEKGPHEPIG